MSKKPCPHCDVLSEDQKAQLSVPVYQKKKEKREQKNMDKNSDNSTETLVDPALVSVVGVIPSDKKSVKSPEPAINKEKSKKKHSTPSKKVSTDEKLEAMDQRWSERFSRLEAFFVSKSLEGSHPTFQTIKMPTKTPPAGAVKGSEPFLQSQASDHTAGRPGLATDQTCVPKNDRLQSSDIQQPTNRTLSDLSPTAPHQVPGPSGWQSGQNSDNDMDTDSDGDLSHHQTGHIIEDEEFSDPDNDIPNADTDQALSEEQSYRETVRGIRSFMGWNHVDHSQSGTGYIQIKRNLWSRLPSGVVNQPNSTLVTAEWQDLQLYQPQLRPHAPLARILLDDGRGWLGSQPTYAIKRQALAGALVRYSPVCKLNLNSFRWNNPRVNPQNVPVRLQMSYSTY